MLGRVKIDGEIISTEDIIKIGNNLYEVVERLLMNNALVECGGELMYVDEICFDYKNKQIYVPYIKCKYAEIPDKYFNRYDTQGLTKKYNGYRIAYKNERAKYVIYENGKYLIDRLYVVVNIKGKMYKKGVDISNLPLCSREDKDASDLFNRYVQYCYGIVDETDYDIFYPYKKSKLSKIEQSIIKELGLEYYGEYLAEEYRDVRMYEYSKVESLMGYDRIGSEQDFNIRRFKFEAELMTRIQEKVYWKHWTKGSIEKILSGVDYFCKHKENGISLIFKREWL